MFSEAYAQEEELTFYQDIAPIIHENCTPCHSPNGPGPFNLITYDDVARRGEFVAFVTEVRYMPPWFADPSFQTYKNERILSEADIEAIRQWYQQGMKEGKPNRKHKQQAEKAVEEFPILGRKPDVVLKMNEPFQIPDNNADEFRFFNVPTQLTEDVYLEAIEFIPGNKRLVHHSRVMVDTTNLMRGIDGLSETDPKAYAYQKIPLVDEFLYGWVPGNLPIKYPEGTGKKLYKDTDLILNIHYSPSSVEALDQSEVHLYFAKTPVTRDVKTLTLTENDITNQPFVLPANTKPRFYMSSGALPEAMSLISVMPHMHVLGKTFKAFAVTPEGNVVNLIKIDEWDFNWQTTYQFKSLLHLPKGSVIIAEATYDNTRDNPQNPNVPPKDVTYGWNTSDEMMNLVLYYVPYQQGDEQRILYSKQE